MLKQCLKCGQESEVTPDPLVACPKCGAIYARVEAAAEQRRQAEEKRMRDEAAESERRSAAEEKLKTKQREQLALHEQRLRPSHQEAAPASRDHRRSWLSTITWAVAAVFAVYGGVEFYFMLQRAESAPQQAVAAGVGLAYAVIPYCLARALERIIRG